MELATGIVSTVFGLYKDINPSTLGGVNDIIVVEGSDGTLRCSPFELRFGKMHMFRITSRVVHIYVNGAMTDIAMTMGKQGELYFEVNEHTDLTESFAHLDIRYACEPPEEIVQLSDTDASLDLYPVRKTNAKHKSSSVVASAQRKRLYTRKHIEDERVLNLEKRKYFKARNYQHTNPYHKLTLIHNTFDKLISSFEYFDFVSTNHRRLLHILKGIWLYPVKTGARCAGNLDEGCRETFIRFSLCGMQKTDKDIEHAFDGYEVQRVRDCDKLVVQLGGCESCRIKFYFPFNLFTEIHFIVRAFLDKKSQEHVFKDFLEKEREKRRKWSFFTRAKPKKEAAWSLELGSEQLKSMSLRYGSNDVVFKLSGVDQKLKAKMFLWKRGEKIIVSDVDGTITKSDVRGHLYGFVGKDWTHKGVAKLYTKIVGNGYKVIYLTTRPLGQSGMTRFYLENLEQDGGKLPEGPILHSPDGLFAALYREIISRNPQSFKISCLQKIQALFDGEFPFVSGFGNKLSDVITYKTVGIAESKIFTINPQGNIVLELTNSLKGTHQTLNSFVDAMFPELNAGNVVDFDNRFTDLTFWKIPDDRF